MVWLSCKLPLAAGATCSGGVGLLLLLLLLEVYIQRPWQEEAATAAARGTHAVPLLLPVCCGSALQTGGPSLSSAHAAHVPSIPCYSLRPHQTAFGADRRSPMVT
jgi:hypothetical protein